MSRDAFILRSPDGRLDVALIRRRRGWCYRVCFDGRPVILESELVIELDNHRSQLALAVEAVEVNNWYAGAEVVDVRTDRCDTTWRPVYGERSVVEDRYQQMTVTLRGRRHRQQVLQWQVRAYDAGVAFRTVFPEDPTAVYYHIVTERTRFTLPPGTQAWYEQWAQGPYQRLRLADWPDSCERPLTLCLPDGLTVCLAEAGLVDYARTHFRLHGRRPDTLVTDLYGPVDVITPYATPWRVIAVAERPGQLLERNDLLLNLNEPCALGDTDWIRPGKCLRDMTVSTAGARACIDFAAAHHLQYILIDWGWYGLEREMAADATRVAVHPDVNPNGNLDLPGVIRYGRQRGIGVWLYVNQRALVRQLDEILPLYRQWGVAGIKFGFVQVGSQFWTTWLHEAVRKAAEHRLLVDIHDEYRPTGFSRTYPNLLTQEGIRGNEEMPDADHNCVLPFTRFVAGAADYTISYYKQAGLGDFHGKRIRTTSAHQLALAVICYSPLQLLFWYDRPEDYQGEPEIEFFERVPTVWDDTRVPCGEIGRFAVVARRSGRDWFVGAITNRRPRRLELPLDFLETGTDYRVTSYADGPAAPTRTRVGIHHSRARAGDTLSLDLADSGGQALWLRPMGRED